MGSGKQASGDPSSASSCNGSDQRHLVGDAGAQTGPRPRSCERDDRGPPDSEEGTASEDYPAPPDGGWGWMVVLSSFLIHVIADGIVYSFGVFLMEFVQFFDAGRGAVSWVGALQPAVTFTVGPLASALTNKYGCRAVTIAGALIASAGFILSMVAPNLYFLYFSAGIMSGLGFGLIYLPAIVCVAQYFEKRRAFATGLAVCGSGFGTFLLAPITELLVSEFSWRGAMLIIGGLVLNVVVCGILFRPLKAQFPSTPASDQEKVHGESGETGALLPGLTIDDVTESSDPTSQAKNGEADDVSKYEGGEGVEKEKEPPSAKSLSNGGLDRTPKHPVHKGAGPPTDEVSQALISVDGTSQQADSPPSDLLCSASIAFSMDLPLPSQRHRPEQERDERRSLSSAMGRPNQNAPTPQHTHLAVSNVAYLARSDGALHRATPSKSPGAHRRAAQASNAGARLRHNSHGSHGSVSSVYLSPLSRKDIFYSGSLVNISMHRSQHDMYRAVSTISIHEVTTSDLDDSSSQSLQGSCWWCRVSEDFKDTMRQMLSFSLLKNPVFLMFAISNFFTSIGFNMPFIFLPDRAKLAGVAENEAALLLSVIGIANTAGRVFFGFLSDRKGINRLFLYNSALTICGIATAFSPLVGGDYALLVTYAAVFGVFIGVYVSLTSVVLVDLLGLEYLTNSFGLLLLFQGAATFVGPPIAGWLCDWTGSYDISFILMGTLIAISGSMLFFLPLVQRRCGQDRSATELHIPMASEPSQGTVQAVGLDWSPPSDTRSLA